MDKLKNVAEVMKLLRFSKKLIIIMFIEMGVFTAFMVVTHWITGSTPDELIRCFFAFWGIEGGMMAAITICKNIVKIFSGENKGRQNRYENEQDVLNLKEDDDS